MPRNSGFAGILLAFAFTCAAFAAGRGGFEGGGGSQPHSAPPAGSGSFRPSGGGESRRSFPEPSGGGGRAPIPRAPAQVFQRPVIEPQHAPPVAPGRASILPSLNTGNRALTPRVVQPIQAPSLPRAVPVPAQRSATENDFLGFRSDHSENRPGISNRPNTALNPGVVNRSVPPSFPAARAAGSSAARAVLPNPPGRSERPARPPLPERWRNVSNNFNSQFNHWQQASAAGIASFRGSRPERWNQIQQRGNDPNWPRQFRSAAYQSWRRDVWNFRRDRAEEVWEATRDMHENLFDNHWWSTCWWRRNPWAVGADVSPWWWWNAANWADTAAFFGSTIGPQPIPYDPGTTVFYDGDSYVLDGQDDGTAADASDQAVALAGPPVDDDDVPVPEPPADGQPPEWLSLGAWALTQQEQGNPVMFFQISVNKDGIVAGGYKNALTGDEQPIVGRLDRRNQRVAWHINNSPQTVFETGLSDLNYDVASVFVHFGDTQTQTWLMVRLPSPATPPATVNVPQ
jgi:hypothetical protein